MTACWVICQKTSDFYESPNLSGVVILWADLEGGAGRILECLWSFLKLSSSLFLLHQMHHISWAKKCSYPLKEAGQSQRSQSLYAFWVKVWVLRIIEKVEFSPKKILKQLFLFLKQNTSTQVKVIHLRVVEKLLNVKMDTDSKKCCTFWYFCNFHAANWFVESLWLTLSVIM